MCLTDNLQILYIMFNNRYLCLGHGTQHNDTRPKGLIAAQLLSIMISGVSNSFSAMLGAIVISVDMLSDVVTQVIILSPLDVMLP